MSLTRSIKAKLTRRNAGRAGLLILFVYLVACVDFYIRQEWYLIEPEKDPTGMQASKYAGSGVELKLPTRQGDDGEVYFRKYYTPNQDLKGTVYFLHGNRGDMDRCECEIDYFLDLGYDVWTMDYRGFGRSRGTPSETALRQDALDVYEQIVCRHHDKPLIIWGRSFGSGIAASVAAATKRKPAMLVLETPYWSMVDHVRQRCPLIPSVLVHYKLLTHEYILNANYPIHLIHGTMDTKLPAQASERLLSLRDQYDLSIKGHSIMSGTHNLRDPKTAEDFHDVVLRILKP